ncbi:putative hydrogenase 2 b cytochrome subunit [Slackia heliotrinireducens]|uniref:Formate-dependent nitrite reductase, membrane component n=1 Tax=Slackia heliotrinireducens (strain ATCC 29202 / DSM 20476 / NCTC 11029 / RHS 1) TaxID=471855 RepID=C7N714_SLAHD|nr:NrfD/PsrC family molybdoenzyme membrane anchor subunit [Slackia heliotrinireducens]ACV22699.1 formate-dependent nitrite reductase, membrane component [Slackia heliotrinireducens DSM 20476]VEH01304.1 putative hydrogenase 2 b cytochrome subunit [Slackia heliotrinireducens]
MENLQLIWNWQPAMYLFLGGMGAGAFVTAAIMFLRNRDAHRPVVNASAWVAVVSLGVGLLLLVTELVSPLRGLMLWQSFSHFTSWMTIGAWIIFCAVIAFGVFALLTTPAIQDRMGAKQSSDDGSAEGAKAPLRFGGLLAALAVLGIVLGFAVAVYTGVLLMSAPGVPLWNTPILPVLFTVSAFDTGIAAVEVVAWAMEKRDPVDAAVLRKLDRAVVLLASLEIVVLAVFIGTMLVGNPLGGSDSASFAATAQQSVRLMLSGVLAPFFWVLLVVVGLAVPLYVAFRGSRAHISLKTMATGAACALVGGCVLRFAVVLAGMHVDYVADTFINVLI